MAPRWFKNIDFGRDVTNIGREVYRDIIQKYKDDLEKKIVDDLTFTSQNEVRNSSFTSQNGPIIEEVHSECESPDPTLNSVGPLDELFRLSPSLQPLPLSRAPTTETAVSSQSSTPSLISRSAPPSPEDEPTASNPVDRPSVSRPEHRSTASRTNDRLVAPSSHIESGRPIRNRRPPADFARGERYIYQKGEIVDKFPGYPASSSYFYRRKKSQTTKPAKVPKGAICVEACPLKAAKKGDYLFNSGTVPETELLTGTISIPPSKKKPEVPTCPDKLYRFLCPVGQILITTPRGKFYLTSKSDWLLLDAGERYSIRNCGSQDATVKFDIVDRS